MPDPNPVKILIADDHAIVRHCLRQTLCREDGITVVAEAENGRRAFEMAAEHNPDLVLMDVSMPEMNGIEASLKILKTNPGIKIIALSMYSEKQYVLAMMKSGARGYLLKTNLFGDLLAAIRTVMEGNVFLSSEITEHIVNSAINPDENEELLVYYTLTSREREILQLIAEGRTHSEIAQCLFISRKTVDSHRLNIMQKLNLNNVPALTKFAVKHGITSLDA
nr:response regulator transcription factor [Desulfobacula sp.]